jgi:hypothetical protein
MVIFGLGAAALLRATHEEFASLPLKQMPEVTFGSREETQQPTLAVLQVDTPAGPEHADTPAAAAPGAQPDSTDAASAATDSTASAASPALPDTAAPPGANTAPSAEAATEKPSEPPRVETSIEAGDAVRPDSANAGAATTDVAKSDAAAKTDTAKTDVAKSDAPKADAGASDVAETMTSPFGARFKPPLPGRRPTQIAQATGKASSVAKRSSAKPPVVKRARHRHVIQHPRRVRPVAPNPALQPASPFE